MFFNSNHSVQYNSVSNVPGGSIVVLFIKDSAESIKKMNAEIFSKHHNIEQTSNTCCGPYLCIWERSDGSRYCKETQWWPTTSNEKIFVGDLNQYNHRLISVVDSINKKDY